VREWALPLTVPLRLGRLSKAYIAPAQPADHAAILEMVERHEVLEPATIAAYWLRRQPQACEVFHAGSGPPLGFVVHLLLNGVP
jgi:hypothetical protein